VILRSSTERAMNVEPAIPVNVDREPIVETDTSTGKMLADGLPVLSFAHK
jgi:hypothetical protein